MEFLICATFKNDNYRPILYDYTNGYNIFSSSDFGVRSENGSIEKTGLFSSSSKVKHYATKYYGNIKRNKAYRFSNSI